MPKDEEPPAEPAHRPEGFLRVRAPRDAAAGIFLIGLAAIAYWGTAHLPWGTLGEMGPGMLPKALALLTGACGLGLLIGAFFSVGEGLESWACRGPLCVLGATVGFALSVRPLGLVVAAPIAVVISALASRDTHWIETIVFAAVMTLFCLGLFRFALGLPIPVAPWLIDY